MTTTIDKLRSIALALIVLGTILGLFALFSQGLNSVVQYNFKSLIYFPTYEDEGFGLKKIPSYSTSEIEVVWVVTLNSEFKRLNIPENRRDCSRVVFYKEAGKNYYCYTQGSGEAVENIYPYLEWVDSSNHVNPKYSCIIEGIIIKGVKRNVIKLGFIDREIIASEKRKKDLPKVFKKCIE